MVYSSSITAHPSEVEQIYLSKHLAFAWAAIVIGLIASSLPSWFWKYSAPVLYLLTLAMLVAVLFPGVGRTVNGAQRWFRIGSISIQPSETAKITLPLLICAVRFQSNTKPTLKTATMLLGIIILTVVLIASEPDLGTAVFVGMTAMVALFLSGWPLRNFFMCGVLAVPAVATLFVLRPYQLARIQGFVNTWQDPETAPYQIHQSLTTMGVGGLIGTGLGRGWQKLSFLPEANTDFIFAVIGEELGLVGTLGVVFLWIGLYWTGRKLIARVPRNSFESVAAATLLTQLVLQAAINVAVVTAMVPPKGISHPLISYGGSNLVVSLTAVGIILSLTRAPETIVNSETDPALDTSLHDQIPTAE